jgi:cyclic pyranopterin phosphate synthase
VRIYAFEGIDEWLDNVPLAARRALEGAGCKVPLVAWRRMRVSARVAITSLGEEGRLDGTRVHELLVEEGAPFEPKPGAIDPSASTPPADIVRALGPDRPLDAAAWRALRPLDRWVFARLARRAKPERLHRAYDEIVLDDPATERAVTPLFSTHLNARGEVHMVDVGAKDVTIRHAIARAQVHMSADTVQRLKGGATPKGDVLATARVAAIQAAKRTPELIPLCHAIALTRVDVAIAICDWGCTVDVRVEARDRTGVEMEAMVAASAGALTLYDMLKGIDRGIRFEIALVEKAGGKSGTWTRTG